MNHDDDPRTCPVCHCTRETRYSGHKPNGAPIGETYHCSTPFCDEFDPTTHDQT
jgi:hypothetical protein